MQLYLLRHGEAGKRLLGALARLDAGRELTKEGRKTARRTAKALRALGCAPAAAVSSPLPRAFQTAEIAAEALGAGGVEKIACLAPGSRPEAFLEWLRGRGEKVLLAAGHMPHLGALAGTLTGAGPGAVEFCKSGACRIDFAGRPGAGRGRLVWLLQPEQLKALRKAWKK